MGSIEWWPGVPPDLAADEAGQPCHPSAVRVLLVLTLVALPALASAHDFLLWPGDIEDDALALRLLVHDGHALGDERAFRGNT